MNQQSRSADESNIVSLWRHTETSRRHDPLLSSSTQWTSLLSPYRLREVPVRFSLHRSRAGCGNMLHWSETVARNKALQLQWLTRKLQMPISDPPTTAASLRLLPVLSLPRQLESPWRAKLKSTSSCAPPSRAMSARDAGSSGRSCGVDAAEGLRTCNHHSQYMLRVLRGEHSSWAGKMLQVV